MSTASRQAPASLIRGPRGNGYQSSLCCAAVAGPDPALPIHGSKLAMNPSVHSAVPKACQLAETKPFVGPLNPADGEMDSKCK